MRSELTNAPSSKPQSSETSVLERFDHAPVSVNARTTRLPVAASAGILAHMLLDVAHTSPLPSRGLLTLRGLLPR
jgi:hypothetical protein